MHTTHTHTYSLLNRVLLLVVLLKTYKDYKVTSSRGESGAGLNIIRSKLKFNLIFWLHCLRTRSIALPKASAIKHFYFLLLFT